MAERISLLQKVTVSATGQGNAKAVAGAKELLVFIDITDEVTTPVLTVYLQSSSDGGSTWYDIPHRGAMILSAAAGEPAIIAEGKRNIADAAGDVGKHVARYTEFGDNVRLAHVFSGAGSFDLRGDMVAK